MEAKTIVKKGIIDDNFGKETLEKKSLSNLIRALLMSASSLKEIANRVIEETKKDVNEFNDELADVLNSSQKQEVQVPDETPLINPIYSGNPVVAAASAVAGFDVTKEPPVEETSDIPVIVPVSIATPSVQDPVTAAQPIGQVPSGESVVAPNTQVDETPTVQMSTAGTSSSNTLGQDTDPVISAINTELVRPKAAVQEPEQILQTPQAFEAEAVSKETAGEYVNVIDEMVKVKEKHLLELRKIQEDIDAKFDALREKYQNEFDDLVRKTEKLREEKANLTPIKEALDSQSEALNNQYVQGTQYGR